jgi:hypothetical protein
VTPDPYGRGRYPTRDPDWAWRRFRKVVSSQPSPVLEALRVSVVAYVETAEEGCRTCDGAALTLAELVKLLDVEVDSRHTRIARTIDALTQGGEYHE